MASTGRRGTAQTAIWINTGYITEEPQDRILLYVLFVVGRTPKKQQAELAGTTTRIMAFVIDDQNSTVGDLKEAVTTTVTETTPTNGKDIYQYREKEGNGYILSKALNTSLTIFIVGVMCFGVILLFADFVQMKRDILLEALSEYKAKTCGA